MPPPTPVPRITPKAVRALRAAPSTASDSAKQLASLAMRISRPIARSRSCLSGRPLRHVELELRMRPVAGESAPGDEAGGGGERAGRAYADARALVEIELGFAHELRDERERRVVIAGRRRLAAAQELVMTIVERDDLGLGAAEIDADAQHARRYGI
jgi:hypothetical protein